MKRDIVNLAKAMLQVQAAVKGMEKNSRVGAGNSAYNGTKDQDVKEVFNEQFTKHGLLIMPIDIQETTTVDRWQETDNYGTKTKQSVFTKATVKYLLVHAESGESIELVGYGHGVDSQDKAAGKATTYALKNCLLYTFLTPVGKIDDSETTHSEQIEVPKTVQVTTKKKVADTAIPALIEYAKENNLTLVEILKSRDLTASQIDIIKKEIK
jgi:hypothetical protein